MKRLFGFGGASAAADLKNGSSAKHPDHRDESSAADDDRSENSSQSSQSSGSSSSGDDESSSSAGSLDSMQSMTSVGSIQYLFQKVNRSYNAVRARSIEAFKNKLDSPRRPPVVRNNSSSVHAVPEEAVVNHGIDEECECTTGEEFDHGLVEGDHVIRWKMLGYLYPIQIHGIVLSTGPDIVTIVDFGLTSVKCYDKVGNFDEEAEIKVNKYNKTRRRMNVVTLADEKEIKKWSKVRYGEEVEIKVHDKREQEKAAAGGSSQPQGLEMEKDEGRQDDNDDDDQPIQSSSSRWLCSSRESADSSTKKKKSILKLPNSDPSKLVLSRLRFLLEYGEEAFPPPREDQLDQQKNIPTLLPPHHLLYANSECIAVWVKTGHWSTLQGSIFLHSSTVGNAKQTATLAMFLSAQTATVPASGLWGWLGGTTTVSLFVAQPWIVPALIGGGVVYIGLPTMLLWKAKGRWSATEKRLNEGFWSTTDNETIVDLVKNWDYFANGEVASVREVSQIHNE